MHTYRDTDFDTVEELLKNIFLAQDPEYRKHAKKQNKPAPTEIQIARKSEELINLLLSNSESLKDIEKNMDRLDELKTTYLEIVQFHSSNLQHRKEELLKELASIDSELADIINLGSEHKEAKK